MGVYKVGNIWYIDYYCEGRRIREPASKRKTEAEEMLEARKTDIIRGEFRLPSKKKIKFKDYAEEYLEKYSKVNKRAWIRDQSALKHLKFHFKELMLSKITPKHIEEYKRKRLERAKPSTVNRELTVLKSMFSTAERWRYTNDNPVKKVKFLQERQYVMRILNKEEIKRLISNSGGHLKFMIILALNTGMRKGEIFNLRWNDIDFAEHYIYIKETKTNVMRKVPMNSVVSASLKGIKRENDLVFPSPRAKKRYSYIYHQFKATCRRAGISDLRFHDLRHTAATFMVMGGIDLVTVKEILGHSSIEMTMRYAHPTPENKRQAVNVLSSMFGSEQKIESRRITTGHNLVIKAN